MSKTFGYTKRAGKDWFSSDAYSDKEIEAIKDPEGGTEISLPTAIPSPFARIDLVKTAFRNMAKSPDLKNYTKDGDVIASVDDEKLVSECLDLTEMLFNMDSIKEKIKIIVWDREAELAALKASSDMHRRFAETLELYLEQDEKSYNFDQMRRLYLIEYNHKIIGCTSPATLFFASANDLSDAQLKLTKNDTIFDHHYTPLYERDPEFQRYFYLLFKANPVLLQRMNVVADYLNRNLKILDRINHSLYQEINKLEAASFFSKFSEIDTGRSGEVVEVIGVTLRKRKREDIIGSLRSSDFLIQSSKKPGHLMPLVLQNNLNKPFRYANDNWESAITVPFIDRETVLEKRWLPGVRIQYPYLTVSDFLEPYLVRLVYPVNKEKFFDGNVIAEVGDDSKGFMLPLKKLFFDYFTSTDLLGSLPGKPNIEMVQGAAGSVKVTLRIPVARQGEYISFERIYYQSAENQLSKSDEEKNKGIVVEQQVGITLFPFIKTNTPGIKAYYRVQLVDRNISGLFKTTEYTLQFYADPDTSRPIEVVNEKQLRKRSNKQATDATSQYYVLNNEFDIIQVRDISNPGISGMILPKWQYYEAGNEVFSFSIDFGTTNTHVEYKCKEFPNPKAFDITPDDIQIATLFDPVRTTEDFGGTGAIAIRELIEHEFVPQLLGNKSNYKFPQRTVIAHSHSLDVASNTTFTLSDFNIPFVYEKKPERDKVNSNLKWAKNDLGNERKVSAFFEKLLMLLRNKVLLKHGNLGATKIVWFYPSSMKHERKARLEEKWNTLFMDYFHFVPQHGESNASKNGNLPVGILESLAPFYYFKGSNKLKGTIYKPVVSIDIGGGTTDIVVFKNKPILLTSFKFAANVIFGDGFNEYGAASSNGLITKYSRHFEDLLAVNKLHDLSKVLLSIKERNRTEDLVAFFFSIENDPKIRDKSLFSFNSLLAKDEDLKIIFLYFYCAIIYHVAEIMKAENIELPKHLIFSGTGSKILNIITPDMKTLSNLSKKIFERVYDKEFDADGLSIETEKEIPKEVTCKGGLLSNPEDLVMDITAIKYILTCLESKGTNRLSYEQLTSEAKAEIANYIGQFNAFFLRLNQEINFSEYFGVSEKAWTIFKTEFNKHLRDYLEEGLEYNKKMDEVQNDEKELEETLFFYPLIGSINHLVGNLSALTPVNN